jgi:hypothetical protein
MAARSVAFDDMGNAQLLGSIGTPVGCDRGRSAPLWAISEAGALAVAPSVWNCFEGPYNIRLHLTGAARGIVQFQAAANRLTSSKVSMFGHIHRRRPRSAA